MKKSAISARQAAQFRERQSGTRCEPSANGKPVAQNTPASRTKGEGAATVAAPRGLLPRAPFGDEFLVAVGRPAIHGRIVLRTGLRPDHPLRHRLLRRQSAGVTAELKVEPGHAHRLAGVLDLLLDFARGRDS